MPTKLEEMAGQIKAARTELKAYFDKKGPDGTLDVDAAGRDAMKALDTKLNDLVPRYEQLRGDALAEESNRKALDELSRPVLPAGFHGGGNGDGAHLHQFAAARKGFGDLFVESDGCKAFHAHVQAGGSRQGEIKAFSHAGDVKTVFSTAAGFDPFVQRLPGVVLSPQQMPKVIDMIPTAETTQHSIKYMLETTYTSNAAETSEGGQYPESAFAFTEQIVAVNKLSHFIPVTDEQLADAPLVRDYLNGRLENGLRQRLDLQLLVGDGSSPNLRGLFNISGTQTYALSGEPTQDAIYKAMVKVQTVGFADPSGIVMHPLDWQNVRLQRTTQGLYIWGSPDSVGPQRMWGLPLVTTTYCTQGTAEVADFVNYTTLYYRKGVDFLVTNSHNDFFIKGQLAVRADMRVAFVVNRATALCKVTGIV
jgi:HK97 family phage major capsid protein